MRGTSRLMVVSAVGSLLLLPTGCTSPEQARAVEAADGFTTAVATDDGAAACALLAPVTRTELEQTAGRPCEQAVLEEAVAAGDRGDASTYGSMAQVRYADDVVFVSRFGDSWRVVAAGCVSQPAAPYDCRISGR